MAISALVSSYMDENGIYTVRLPDGTVVTLCEVLTKIEEARGKWTPIGMAYNPIPGISTMMTVLYVVVPEGAGVEKYFMPSE